MTQPLRVALPLGIGDTWWTCQRLRALSAYHGGRPIHAYVSSSPNHKSVGFLELIPWIAKAEQSADAPYDINGQLPPGHRDHRWSTVAGCAGWRGFDYVLVANGHLERSQRIETWLEELDPEQTDYVLQPNITQDIRDDVRARFGDNRVLLYFSGVGPNIGFHGNLWYFEHWREVVRRLAAEGIRPLIVGAKTDDDMGYLDRFRMHCTADDLAMFDSSVGDTNISQYCAQIQSAAAWVGLNSGGGIVSAAMGTPTVMMWSDHQYVLPVHYQLPTAMQRSWLNAEQLQTYRTFSYGAPTLTPENVVKSTLEVMRK
jgi:hypothetical protein